MSGVYPAWAVLGGLAVLAAVAALGWWGHLWRAQQAQNRKSRATQDRMQAMAAALSQTTPAGRAALLKQWAADVQIKRQFCIRPVTADVDDKRLVVAYDSQARNRVIEFPTVRPARWVLLASGRMMLLAEEAAEKLLHAENGLRQKLDLDQLPFV